MLTLICVTDIRHMRFRLNSSSVLAWICFPLAWAGVPIFDSSAARHRLSSNFLFLQAMRVHTPLFPAPHLSGVHLFPREDESVNERVLTARSEWRWCTRTRRFPDSECVFSCWGSHCTLLAGCHDGPESQKYPTRAGRVHVFPLHLWMILWGSQANTTFKWSYLLNTCFLRHINLDYLVLKRQTFDVDFQTGNLLRTRQSKAEWRTKASWTLS